MTRPAVNALGGVRTRVPGRSLGSTLRAILAVVPRGVGGRTVHAPGLSLARGDEVADTTAACALYEGLGRLVLFQFLAFPKYVDVGRRNQSPFNLARHIDDGHGHIRGPGVVCNDVVIAGQVTYKRDFHVTKLGVLPQLSCEQRHG